MALQIFRASQLLHKPIMMDRTFHVTEEQLREGESRSTRGHGGRMPQTNEISYLKVSITRNGGEKKKKKEKEMCAGDADCHGLSLS